MRYLLLLLLLWAGCKTQLEPVAEIPTESNPKDSSKLVSVDTIRKVILDTLRIVRVDTTRLVQLDTVKNVTVVTKVDTLFVVRTDTLRTSVTVYDTTHVVFKDTVSHVDTVYSVYADTTARQETNVVYNNVLYYGYKAVGLNWLKTPATNCPPGYRLPSALEVQSLIAAYGIKTVDLNFDLKFGFRTNGGTGIAPYQYSDYSTYGGLDNNGDTLFLGLRAKTDSTGVLEAMLTTRGYTNVMIHPSAVTRRDKHCVKEY